MNKKDFKNYLEQAERMLLDAGFKRTVVGDLFHPQYEWKKETKYGMFYCNPDNDFEKTKKTGIVSIFCRFEDVEKSREIHGNQFTGKMNIHEYGTEGALNELEYFIELVTATNKNVTYKKVT